VVGDSVDFFVKGGRARWVGKAYGIARVQVAGSDEPALEITVNVVIHMGWEGLEL
jgi:hypothetical protein